MSIEKLRLEAALAYAARGIPVFPCRPRDKRPAVATGFKAATLDAEQIRSWWTENSEFNIGAPTGPASGFDVIDGDGETGCATLLKADLPATPIVRTPGGGIHLFFRHAAERAIRNAVKLRGLQGCDTRGGGGYVLLPPSVGPNGKEYRWEASLDEIEAPLIPAEIFALLTSSHKSGNGREQTAGDAVTIPQGRRNAVLMSMAGAMRRRRFTPDAIRAALQQENRLRCSPPLEDSEIEQIARNVAHYDGAGQELPAPLIAATGAEIMKAAATAVDWTIKPILTRHGVRLISGLGKSYKSTFATALSMVCINGGPLTEHFWAQGGDRVAIVDAENRLECWARKALPIAKGLGLDLAQLVDGGRLLYFNRRALFLDDPGTLETVIETLKAAEVTEIFIDSLTRVHRKDENKAADMSGLFLDSIFRIRDEVGAGVTLLHHHRKPMFGSDDPGQALRGTVDLRNVVDTHIALSRTAKDTSGLRVEVTAQREAEEGGPFYLGLDWGQEGVLTFEKVEPGEGQLQKAEAAKVEILAYLEGTTEGEASRPLIVQVMTQRGHTRRTIERALKILTEDPASTVHKTDTRPSKYALKKR